MHSIKWPVILLSALALAAPASSYAKDNDKNKNKDKGKSAQHDDRGGHDNHGEHHDGDDKGGDKITICHVPGGDQAKRHTLSVGAPAWEAHRGHGDTRGACGASNPGPGNGSRFDALDRNHNGVISRDEWVGDAGTFDRLDSNDDGVISRREFNR